MTGSRGEADSRAATPAILVAVVLVVAVFVLGFAVRGGPLAIDTTLTDWLAASFPPAATQLFNAFGELPVFGAVGLAGAGICLLRGRRAMAASFILGLGVEVATTIVKVAVDRPRPPGGTDVEAFITAATYPSGHVVRVLVIGGLLVAAFAGRRGLPRWGPVALAAAVAVLVGCARVASHEHWPSDVVGGWLLGAAWLSLCLAVETVLRGRLGDR